MTTKKVYLLLAMIALTFLSLLALGVIFTGHHLFIQWNYEPITTITLSHQDLSLLPVATQIKRVFKGEWKVALAVATQENYGFDCDKESPTHDTGIFQINRVHLNRWSIEQLKDCTQNILIAKTLKDEQGWKIWTAYQSGAYKKYLQ